MNMPPDSACLILQKLHSLLPQFSTYERALYTLQQLNAFYRNNQELLPYATDLDEALEFFLKDRDKVNIGKAYLQKGRLEVEKVNVEQAIFYFQNAISYLSSKEHRLYLAMSYSDLGNVYMYQRLFDEALECHRKSRMLYQDIGDIKGSLIEINSIAYLYIFKGRVGDAMSIYEDALRQVEQMNDTLLWVSVLNNAGVTYGKIGRDTEALHLLRLSVALSPAHGSEPIYQSLAEVFLKIGNRDSASKYLKKAVLSERIETRASAYALLSELQKGEADFCNAMESLENYQSCLDSIHSMTKTLEIARMSYKYELDLSLLQAHNKHRLWVIFICLGFFIILSFVIGLFLYWNKRKKLSALLYQHQLLEQKNSISSLNNQLLELQNELLLLQPSVMVKNAENDIIETKEQELEIMRNKVLKLCVRLFESTHIGQKIILENKKNKQKEPVNLLKVSERTEMIENLDDIFEDIINSLLMEVSALTKEDCYFCCLSLLELSTQTLAACFGYSDGQAIRQRKYRIKQKMELNNNTSYLYKQLFGI